MTPTSMLRMASYDDDDAWNGRDEQEGDEDHAEHCVADDAQCRWHDDQVLVGKRKVAATQYNEYVVHSRR